MKKIITVLLLLSILCAFSLPTYAAGAEGEETNIGNTQVVYFDDGSYVVTTLEVETIGSGDSGIAPASTTQTIQGTRTAIWYSDDGDTEWEYILIGLYTVELGVSAVCTSASYTKTIYKSGWKFSDGSATAEGNVAYGGGVFKKKVLFITTKTATVDISITCDIYGNLS